MAQLLEILADLRLAVDGEEIDIWADGDRIVVNLPSLQAGRRVLAAEPLARDRSRTLRRSHTVLEAMGISAELRLNGTPFARVGAGAQPGRLGQILGLSGVELEPSRPVRAAIRCRPVLAFTVFAGLVLLISMLLMRSLRS